jgi:Fe-Mn family superoxide dismutase
MSLSVELPALPFDYSALEPHISEKTMRFHHDKHHASYVKFVEKAVSGTQHEGKNIIEIIRGMTKLWKLL